MFIAFFSFLTKQTLSLRIIMVVDLGQKPQMRARVKTYNLGFDLDRRKVDV
jgi:hypothetical protein